MRIAWEFSVKILATFLDNKIKLWRSNLIYRLCLTMRPREFFFNVRDWDRTIPLTSLPGRWREKKASLDRDVGGTRRKSIWDAVLFILAATRVVFRNEASFHTRLTFREDNRTETVFLVSVSYLMNEELLEIDSRKENICNCEKAMLMLSDISDIKLKKCSAIRLSCQKIRDINLYKIFLKNSMCNRKLS